MFPRLSLLKLQSVFAGSEVYERNRLRSEIEVVVDRDDACRVFFREVDDHQERWYFRCVVKAVLPCELVRSSEFDPFGLSFLLRRPSDGIVSVCKLLIEDEAVAHCFLLVLFDS